MNAKGPLMSVVKFFAHGVGFAVVMFGLSFVWGYLAGWFSFDVALLVLLLIFAGLAVAWGVLNTVLTRVLWFPMRKGLKIYLGHGLLLFFALFMVEWLPVFALIPLFVEVSVTDQVLILVILLVVYAFGDGYMAKTIGGHWRVRGGGTELAERAALLVKSVEIKPDNPGDARCPRCGGANLVVAGDKSAYCLDCKKGIRREAMGGTST